MINKIEQNPENTSNLEKYFKKVYTCQKCNRQFGSDHAKNDNLCPNCNFQRSDHFRHKSKLPLENVDKDI